MVIEVLIIISGILCILFSINLLYAVPRKLKKSSRISEEQKYRNRIKSLVLGLIMISLGIVFFLIYLFCFI